MARQRTVAIVSGQDLTCGRHADSRNGVRGILKTGYPDGGFHLRRDSPTTAKDLGDRRAGHRGQWR
jgi:hypothetical protein